MKVSAATIDRLLADPRGTIGSRRGAVRVPPGDSKEHPGAHVRRLEGAAAGLHGSDLVAHGGESVAGSFAHTLTLTDIASGWTECVALAVRDGSLVVEALERLRATMPFPLRGFAKEAPPEKDTDDVTTGPEASPRAEGGKRSAQGGTGSAGRSTERHVVSSTSEYCKLYLGRLKGASLQELKAARTTLDDARQLIDAQVQLTGGESETAS